MLRSEVKEGQIGTLALVQLGDPPPRQIWRWVRTLVLMLLHNHAVDRETSFAAPAGVCVFVCVISIWNAVAHLCVCVFV